MYNLQMPIPENVSQLYWRTYRWPNFYQSEQEKSKTRLENSRIKIAALTDKNKELACNLLIELKADMNSYASNEKIRQHLDRTDKLTKWTKDMGKLEKLLTQIEDATMILNLTRVELADSKVVFDIYSIYKEFWDINEDTNINLNSWKEAMFIEIDADLILTKINSWNVRLSALDKKLQTLGFAIPLDILRSIHTDINEFTVNTKVITYLRNSALRERHWAKIKGMCGMNLNDFTSLRLVQILELDLELISDILRSISAQANHEYSSEKAIDLMKSSLFNSVFQYKVLVDEGCLYIENGEEICCNLEDYLQKCTKMLPHVCGTTLKPKFDTWFAQLEKARHLMRLWMVLQTRYLKIFRICTNNELMSGSSQIQRAALQSFESVRKTLDFLSNFISKSPKCITLVARSDLIDIVKSGLSRLDATDDLIFRILDDSRQVFSRLWFVSDEDAIYTIGCTTGADISQQVRKYFPGIAEFVVHRVDDKHLHLAHLIKPKARKNSTVAARKSLVLNDIPIKEAIEEVLEDAMPTSSRTRSSSGFISTIRRQSSKSGQKRTSVLNEDIVKSDRVEPLASGTTINEIHGTYLEVIIGIKNHQNEYLKFSNEIPYGSCVANVLSLIHRRMTATLLSELTEALFIFEACQSPIEYWNFLTSNLYQVGSLIIEWKWTEKANSKMGNSIEYFTHIFDFFISKYRSDITYFERVKLETALTILQYIIATCSKTSASQHFPQYHLADSRLSISINDSRGLDYGFEWLPPARKGFDYDSYSKIISCIESIRFPILSGEAGSGKAETVLDLANILGQHCHKVYCSNSLGIDMVKNYFKGFFGGLSWILFVNMDLLAPAILTHCAKTIVELQKQNSLSKIPQNTSSFMYEMISFKASPSITIFGTMKSSSPWSNLATSKSKQFRPINVISPNMVMYLKVALAAKGFKMAKALAAKCELVLKAVQSVFPYTPKFQANILNLIVDVAARYFRDKPNATEALAVTSALQSCIESKLLTEDIQMFHTILKEFKSSMRFIHGADLTAIDKPSQMNRHFDLKLKCFLEMTDGSFNTSVVLFGPFFSGKSSTWQRAANVMRERGKVLVQQIYPDAWVFNELVTSEYDGKIIKPSILDTVYLQAVRFSSCSDSSSIIVVQGLSTNIFNYFQTKNEMCCFPGNLKVIYETHTLSDVSPSFISGQKMIYFEPKMVLGEGIFHKLLSSSSSNVLINHRSLLMKLYRVIHVPAFNNAFSGAHQELKAYYDRITARQLYVMFDSLLLELGVSGYSRFTYSEQCMWLAATFIFAILWVYGAMPHTTSRIAFSSFFQKHICAQSVATLDLGDMPARHGSIADFVKLPTTGNLFDYIFDAKFLKWSLWVQNERPALGSSVLVGDQQIVITTDIRKMAYLAKILLSNNQNIMFTGIKGIGKTFAAMGTMSILDAGQWDQTLQIIGTKGLQIADFMNQFEAMHGKKLRPHSFGSTTGKQNLLFIDDLNSVGEENSHYASLLSMITKASQYYSTDHELCSIENLQIFGEMTHDPTKSDDIHVYGEFMSLCLDDNTLTRLEDIVRSINLATEINPLIEQLIVASSQLCNKLSKRFTSCKRHPLIIFTLRDIVKSLQPIAIIQPKVESHLLSLWVYNCWRVFGDKMRYLQDNSQQYFENTLENIMAVFAEQNVVCSALNICLPYRDCAEKSALVTIAESEVQLDVSIEECVTSSSSMAHVVDACHIAYQLKYIQSNVAIRGLSFCSALDTCRLACEWCKYGFVSFSPSTTESWKEDLRAVYTQSNEKNQRIVFFFETDLMTAKYWSDLAAITTFGFDKWAENQGWPVLNSNVLFICFIPDMVLANDTIFKTAFISKSFISIYLPEACLTSVIKRVKKHTALRAALKSGLKAESLSNFVIAAHVASSKYTDIGGSRTWTKDPIFHAVDLLEKIFLESTKKVTPIYEIYERSMKNCHLLIEEHAALQVGFQNSEAYSLKCIEEANNLMLQIEQERELHESKTREIKRDQEIESKFQIEIGIIRDSCISELAKFRPAVTLAVEGVTALERGDIYDLKGTTKFIHGIDLVMEAVLLAMKFPLLHQETLWDAIKRYP